MCMCEKHLLQRVVDIARVLYTSNFDHGLPHIERVYKWMLKIISAENLNVDLELAKLAAYLHDIGRLVGEPHAYYSAIIAEELLKEVGCSSKVSEEIVTAILSHSFSYAKASPSKSKLAMLLSDADKLDALGIVGFLRVFIFGERNSRSFEESVKHFYDKILKLKDLVHYEYSKAEAEKLTERTRMLLEYLFEETSWPQAST